MSDDPTLPFDPAWLRQQAEAGQVFDRAQVVRLLAAYHHACTEIADLRAVMCEICDQLAVLLAPDDDSSVSSDKPPEIRIIHARRARRVQSDTK